MEIDLGRPLEGRFIGYVLESDGLLHFLGRIYVLLLDYLCILTQLEANHAPYLAHLGFKKMHIDL